MGFIVTFDWKAIIALGPTVSAIIFSIKMDKDSAERVSIHAVDACKESAVANAAKADF